MLIAEDLIVYCIQLTKHLALHLLNKFIEGIPINKATLHSTMAMQVKICSYFILFR